jgi:hypothetical protein
MTYAVRAIVVTFQLYPSLTTGAPQSFGGTGDDTLTLMGLRVFAQIATVINNPVSAGGTALALRIYGMTLDQINQLTKAGTVWAQANNSVMVQAGDAGGQLTTVFNGAITGAYPEFNEPPPSGPAFVVIALTGRGVAMKPVAPVSFDGPTNADTVFSQIAQNAGLAYENNGVNAMLSSPYFPGAAMAQITACSKAADCYAYIEGSTNTLVVIPRGGQRNTAPALIAPWTGMIGYPSYERNQLIVRTLFNPAILNFGPIEVDTGGLFPAAEGRWIVTDLSYSLASQMPDGPWEQSIVGVQPAL